MHINDILTHHNPQALIRRFERLCEKRGPDECWLWKSGRDKPHQYPNFPVGGRPPKGKLFPAMTVGYVLYKGPISPEEDGLFHRHTCDNRRCVNPNHIVLGTHKDNMRDMRERDRSITGERNGAHKLTEAQVLAIRADPRLQKVIAAEYGVCSSNISLIKSGTNWFYLDK